MICDNKLRYLKYFEARTLLTLPEDKFTSIRHYALWQNMLVIAVY